MKLILPILFLLAAAPAFGHGGETHDAPAASAPASEYFTVYAQTQKYELTLRYPELSAGKPAELMLFVADYATNVPLEGIDIKVTAQEDPALKIDVELHEPGTYHLTATFPENKAYTLVVNLSSASHGVDLLGLSPVAVGKKLPEAGEEVVGGPMESNFLQTLLTFIGGFLVGLLVLALLRRRPKALAGVLVLVSLPLTLQQAGAHEGHDEAAGDNSGNVGNVLYIPKETQFLFDIRTELVALNAFQPAIQLYGTIVPAPSGYADITTPQNGRVVSLKVTPGQKVSAGQVVAVLRPSSSQSEQVSVAAETGRLRVDIQAAQAEFNAAEREWNRLRAIADIAAKRDVQAAEARYNAAKSNVDALRSLAGGPIAAAAGGNIVLKAPVAGTIGQFTLATGAEVPAGTTLFSITNLSRVFVEAQVYDQDSELVESGGKFTVTCTNDDHKTAEVRLVSAALEVNPTNQSQRVLFELANPGGDFKIGEFVTLRAFRSGGEKTIFVPNSALSEINGKPVVFLKDAPESYSVSYVSLGEDNGAHTVVLKGIETGERLVTTATYQVKMMALNQ